MTRASNPQMKTRRHRYYKIPKRQRVGAVGVTASSSTNHAGQSSKAFYQDSDISLCAERSSTTKLTIIAATQWSDTSGLFRNRILGPAHPANMGISILREGPHDHRHDATRVESREQHFSLETRVQIAGHSSPLGKGSYENT